MSSARPQPVGGNWRHCDSIGVDIDNPMYKPLAALNRRIDKLAERELELRRKIMGLLRSVHSVGRLLQEWPEGAVFVPSHTPAMPVVAATLTHEINRMLGLEPTPNAAKSAIVKAAS